MFSIISWFHFLIFLFFCVKGTKEINWNWISWQWSVDCLSDIEDGYRTQTESSWRIHARSPPHSSRWQVRSHCRGTKHFARVYFGQQRVPLPCSGLQNDKQTKTRSRRIRRRACKPIFRPACCFYISGRVWITVLMLWAKMYSRFLPLGVWSLNVSGSGGASDPRESRRQTYHYNTIQSLNIKRGFRWPEIDALWSKDISH